MLSIALQARWRNSGVGRYSVVPAINTGPTDMKYGQYRISDPELVALYLDYRCNIMVTGIMRP